MEVEIKTAEELVDPVLEARWMARREAPLTDVLQAVLRAFRDRGGPVSLDAITVALPGVPPTVVRERLVALDEEDLIQLKGDRVEIAYPFSAIPTVFTIRFADGAERHACCVPSIPYEASAADLAGYLKPGREPSGGHRQGDPGPAAAC